jgi:hypothetical protein
VPKVYFLYHVPLLSLSSCSLGFFSSFSFLSSYALLFSLNTTLARAALSPSDGEGKRGSRETQKVAWRDSDALVFI